MSKKENLTILSVMIIIFMVGFILRIESTNIPSISSDEKSYYQDDQGLPYMFELDSYYNYRLTKNVVEHGYIGDTILNGRQWDMHSYYPPGVPMDYPPLLPYLGALFYYLVNIFGNVPLLVICFWLPILIAPLAGVVAYLFLRRFTSEFGAATAGILMSLVPYYFTRTVPGWYDTDIFNILFPLLVVWFFVEAVQSDDTRNRIGFTILASTSMVLFSLAWNGWQYLFYILVTFSLFYFIWCKIHHKKVKNAFYVLGVFMALTLIFTTIFGGYLSIINLIYSPIEFLSVFGGHNAWAPFPNNYIMVNELSKPSLVDVILGLDIALFSGILGFICLYRVLVKKELKNKFLNKISWYLYIFLLVWAIAGFITLLSGIRFIIMLIPPLVISTGLLVGLIIDYLKFIYKNDNGVIFSDIFKNLNLNKSSITIITFLLVILVLLSAMINAYNSISSLKPIVNDDLSAAAEYINYYTPHDTVIITSWTWGHFYTALADRPVVFDGRLGYIETMVKRNYDVYPYKELSPSTSREYWIDKAFSSSNESLSVGIFRMLATSGDGGYLALNKYTNNTTKSVEILNNILGVDKATAQLILKNNYGVSDEKAEVILNFSHPSHPKPFVIITNNGMISKGYWIFHFGEWDFNKQEGMDLTYSVGQMNFTDDKLVRSDNGVVMDTQTGQITWNNKLPYKVLKISHNGTEMTYNDENSDFCIILLMDNNQTVIIDKGLENSLFTKLAMKKTNSSNFKSIFNKKSVTIWEISN